MSGEMLYGLNEWLIALIVFVLFICATEIGFRLGRRVESKDNEITKSQINMLPAASLGLLALLLGFTFSMALARFDTRKQLVLDEANAIGTTYLRAQLLPDEKKGTREKGDVAQKHQNYYFLSPFRIAMAIADAPTPKYRAISAMDTPISRFKRYAAFALTAATSLL